MVHHLYVEGYESAVDPMVAARRVISGEWYVCAAEHTTRAEIPKDDSVVIYHRNPQYRAGRA